MGKNPGVRLSAVSALSRRCPRASGVLQATNGIALLAQRGFDAGITDKAGRVFDWLSTHMAQPADCAGVLARA
ncbi:hypothetical protein VM94_00579 [Janthinobacterium sp. KBS0711]|nr:hypothetical protein VM94_00579 [Janthinobacterium sp. KBS0711]